MQVKHSFRIPKSLKACQRKGNQTIKDTDALSGLINPRNSTLSSTFLRRIARVLMGNPNQVGAEIEGSVGRISHESLGLYSRKCMEKWYYGKTVGK
jgi:hypothetical protein